MPQIGDMTMNLKMWTIIPAPCFDPYGIISKWMEQDLVDCWDGESLRKGSERLIICE